MARWLLKAPHYLNVPGTEWEYKETSRDTGRQVRKIFPVPLFLDPRDVADWNYRDEGIIVAYAGSKHPRDIIFVGPPTPDMDPLDDEAQAISDAERPKWVHPIDTLGGQSYAEGILASFEKQLAALVAGAKAAPPPTASVDAAEFAALKAQVAELMAANATLQAQATPRAERRA